VLSLIALDQLLHPDGVPLPVPMTQDWVGAAARLNQHIGQDRPGIDIDRSDVRHMYRLFLLSDPAGLVLHDARRVMATCVGKRRLPRLTRLARNTSPAMNGRPFATPTRQRKR
jgi:hypothetical protein